jgi:hypothetical protein
MSEAAGTVHNEATNTSSGAARSSHDLTAVTTSVEQLNSSVAEISHQLVEASHVAQQAMQRADSSHATMQGLSEATVRIGDVVHLINNIAGQTNLLALNATIEAARCGRRRQGVCRGRRRGEDTGSPNCQGHVGDRHADRDGACRDRRGGDRDGRDRRHHRQD